MHAEASDDSAMPNAARLASFAAEGVDVLVSSDHDVVGDYRPALAALALEPRMRVIQGVEVDEQRAERGGALHARPLERLADRARPDGASQGSAAGPGAHARATSTPSCVAITAPASCSSTIRSAACAASSKIRRIFTHLGSLGSAADPTLPLEASANAALLAPAADGRTRAIDFDAIELMNGDSREQYLQVREQWHAFLRQGLRRTATANSDTHGPDQIAGYPRNYVYLGSGGWDAAGFDAAIRAGRLFGTNGPLVAEFKANGARMGDDVAAPGGRVMVELAIAAPPWVPVAEVRLLANGEVVRAGTSFRAAQRRRRCGCASAWSSRSSATRSSPSRPGAPLAEDPDAPATPLGDYAVVAPDFVPTAFTNPIFVDADADGRFAAPGLPAPPVRAGRALLALPLALAVILFVWWRRRRSRARR